MYSASSESLSTLQFVQRAKHIKNNAKQNEALKLDAHSLHLEVLKLRDQIKKMQSEGYVCSGGGDVPMDGESGVVDPELVEKLQRQEERCEELESQLSDARVENETSHMENVKLENEIAILRNLKSELQSNINEMMGQFNGWKSKINEAEEITKKATLRIHSE